MEEHYASGGATSLCDAVQKKRTRENMIRILLHAPSRNGTGASGKVGDWQF